MNENKEKNMHIELYRQYFGCEPGSVERLPGAGSNRTYYRMVAPEGTVIACVGTSREENHAFVTLARHFAAKGLPVPRVLAVSDDEMCYLQDDLGSMSLFDAIAQGRKAGGQYNDEERQLLHQAIRLLPRFQFEGAEGLDFSVCYPQPSFDATGIMFDLNYFKYCFLKPSGVDFHEVRLEEDFRRLTEDLSLPQPLQRRGDSEGCFMYRDFQARNIMMGPGSLYFIDFQGGRRGPFYYDLASFLWQASARYPQELREELLDDYYETARQLHPMPPREQFNERLQLFVFFRLLQVLGAYGYRGYFERKQHFIDSIPPALDNLRQLLNQQSLPYPHLTDVLGHLLSAQKGDSPTATAPVPSSIVEKPGRLCVRIFSFSYKRGIPQDESGNGGGYVFDCRGTHNPGRYEQYKHMTGLDEPVIKFLEDDGEILRFLEHVYQLADAHVQRYIERGFTSLMFSFGCTGGQHRSVYSAQHLAEHLHRRFPTIEIRLCHREQNISQVFCCD